MLGRVGLGGVEWGGNRREGAGVAKGTDQVHS